MINIQYVCALTDLECRGMHQMLPQQQNYLTTNLNDDHLEELGDIGFLWGPTSGSQCHLVIGEGMSSAMCREA